MAHNFGSLIFTHAIKALQEKYGSRRQYARMEQSGSSDRLSPMKSRSSPNATASIWQASVQQDGLMYNIAGARRVFKGDRRPHNRLR
jgi:hypothetical protein